MYLANTNLVHNNWRHVQYSLGSSVFPVALIVRLGLGIGFFPAYSLFYVSFLAMAVKGERLKLDEPDYVKCWLIVFDAHSRVKKVDDTVGTQNQPIF